MNIRVLSVERLATHFSGDLIGNLERPLPGETVAPTLCFGGWLLSVLSIKLRRVCVEVDLHTVESTTVSLVRPDVAEYGRSLGLTEAEELCGFSGEVNLALLPSPVELTIAVRTWDNVRMPVYRLVVEHDAGLGAQKVSPSPVLLTTLGRTGSTWLSALLSLHPDILCEAEAEPRVGLYWLSVLHGLSRPKSYLRKYDALDLADPNWWLGGDDIAVGIARSSEPVEALLGHQSTGRLANFAFAELSAHYLSIAKQKHKSTRYFLEKYLPNMFPDLMSRLVDGTKEVFLVRDWRDVVASMSAYGHQRNRDLFGVGLSDTMEKAIKAQVRSVEMMRLAWNRRKNTALLVRYEDLVVDLEGQLRRIFEYLGISADTATLDNMMATVERRSEEFSEHKTTDSLAASIGRWRTDLSPEEGQLATELYRASLETFGYDLMLGIDH